MASALYIITFSRSRWWIDTDGRQHGPHHSRAEAISAAIEAAFVFGEPGVGIEVVAPDPTGRYRIVWSSVRDPYPPPAWVLEEHSLDGAGQSATEPALAEAEPAVPPVPNPSLPASAEKPARNPGKPVAVPALTMAPLRVRQFGATESSNPFSVWTEPFPIEEAATSAANAEGSPEAPGTDGNLAGEPGPAPSEDAGPLQTEDLLMSLQLTRDTIAGWSAEALHYLSAADAIEAGEAQNPDTLASAERSIVAIRMELEGLLDVAARTEGRSDDMNNGISAAVTELENLDRAISSAIERLRPPAET